MKTKYPCLYDGLAQIPLKYLKENLLPVLKDKDSRLIFTGNIANKDGM